MLVMLLYCYFQTDNDIEQLNETLARLNQKLEALDEMVKEEEVSVQTGSCRGIVAQIFRDNLRIIFHISP